MRTSMAEGDEQTTRLPLPATVAGRFRLAAPLPSPRGSDAFLALDLGLGREVVVGSCSPAGSAPVRAPPPGSITRASCA